MVDFGGGIDMDALKAEFTWRTKAFAALAWMGAASEETRGRFRTYLESRDAELAGLGTGSPAVRPPDIAGLVSVYERVHPRAVDAVGVQTHAAHRLDALESNLGTAVRLRNGGRPVDEVRRWLTNANRDGVDLMHQLGIATHRFTVLEAMGPVSSEAGERLDRAAAEFVRQLAAISLQKLMEGAHYSPDEEDVPWKIFQHEQVLAKNAGLERLGAGRQPEPPLVIIDRARGKRLTEYADAKGLVAAGDALSRLTVLTRDRVAHDVTKDGAYAPVRDLQSTMLYELVTDMENLAIAASKELTSPRLAAAWGIDGLWTVYGDRVDAAVRTWITDTEHRRENEHTLDGLLGAVMKSWLAQRAAAVGLKPDDHNLLASYVRTPEHPELAAYVPPKTPEGAPHEIAEDDRGIRARVVAEFTARALELGERIVTGTFHQDPMDIRTMLSPAREALADHDALRRERAQNAATQQQVAVSTEPMPRTVSPAARVTPASGRQPASALGQEPPVHVQELGKMQSP